MRTSMLCFLFSIAVSTLPATAALANDHYRIDAVAQPQHGWRFHQLNAFAAGDVSHVSGRLTAARPMSLPTGHVDIAAYTPDGQPLAQTTAEYAPSLLTPHARKKGGVRFSARFNRLLPDDAVIKVAFHADQSRQDTPSHPGTVAR